MEQNEKILQSLREHGKMFQQSGHTSSDLDFEKTELKGTIEIDVVTMKGIYNKRLAAEMEKSKTPSKK